MINRIKRKLETIAKSYFLTVNTLRYKIEARAISQILDRLDIVKKGDLLLDAGAGSGRMSLTLAKLGYFDKLLGVEPDPKLYSMLEKNYAEFGYKTYLGGLEKLPLEDGSVDGVLSTQVFEHIEDDETAAKEVFRVLKQGGYAVISTPHPPEIFPNEGHVRPGYTVEEMSQLFAPVGLEYLGHAYFCTLPTLRRVVAAEELGVLGRLFSINWADREKGLSQEEIKEQQPYGIVCVFKKK